MSLLQRVPSTCYPVFCNTYSAFLSFPSHPPLQKKKRQTSLCRHHGQHLVIFLPPQRRERKKRDEHRWKVWQFKDMQRSNGPPPLPQSRTFQSSEITLVPSRAPTTTDKQMSEAPRVSMGFHSDCARRVNYCGMLQNQYCRDERTWRTTRHIGDAMIAGPRRHLALAETTPDATMVKVV